MRQVRMLVIGAAFAVSAGQAQAPAAETPQTSAPATNSAAVSPRARISSGVMQGLLVKKVDPKCPRGFNQHAMVVLRVIVGSDGHVVSAEMMQGPPEVKDSAQDVVRQWVYKRYLLNGAPVEVDTTVILEYRC